MWKAVEVDAWIAGRKSSLEEARVTVAGIIDRVWKEGDTALRQFSRHVEVRQRLLSLPRSGKRRMTPWMRRSSRALPMQKIGSGTSTNSRGHGISGCRKSKPVSCSASRPPLNRVGLYIPGGRAAYPSSALMCAVPARVAGVKEICACSPPPIRPITIVALDIAGGARLQFRWRTGRCRNGTGH